MIEANSLDSEDAPYCTVRALSLTPGSHNRPSVEIRCQGLELGFDGVEGRLGKLSAILGEDVDVLDRPEVHQTLLACVLDEVGRVVRVHNVAEGAQPA